MNNIEVGEIWKDIKGYERIYQISTKGNIRNIKNDRNLKPCVNSDGYYIVPLSKEGKRKSFKIHRLVARNIYT